MYLPSHVHFIMIRKYIRFCKIFRDNFEVKYSVVTEYLHVSQAGNGNDNSDSSLKGFLLSRAVPLKN